MADIYKLQCATVDPIDNLLKAIVAVNVYAVNATDAGWDIDFELNEDLAQITVSITRSADDWPTEIDGERAS